MAQTRGRGRGFGGSRGRERGRSQGQGGYDDGRNLYNPILPPRLDMHPSTGASNMFSACVASMAHTMAMTTQHMFESQLQFQSAFGNFTTVPAPPKPSALLQTPMHHTMHPAPLLGAAPASLIAPPVRQSVFQRLGVKKNVMKKPQFPQAKKEKRFGNLHWTIESRRFLIGDSQIKSLNMNHHGIAETYKRGYSGIQIDCVTNALLSSKIDNQLEDIIIVLGSASLVGGTSPATIVNQMESLVSNVREKFNYSGYFAIVNIPPMAKFASLVYDTNNKLKSSSTLMNDDCIVIIDWYNAVKELQKKSSKYSIPPILMHKDGIHATELAVRELLLLLDEANFHISNNVQIWRSMKDALGRKEPIEINGKFWISMSQVKAHENSTQNTDDDDMEIIDSA